MNGYLRLKLIKAYFTADAVLPEQADRQRIFGALCSAYLGDGDEVELKELLMSEKLGEIDTLGNYYLYNRLRTLRDIDNSFGRTDERYDELIQLKGAVLEEIHSTGYQNEGGSAEDIIASIGEFCGRGYVFAIGLYGFMLCEGLCVAADREEGRRILDRAARWNCVDAALLAMHYFPEKAKCYADMLAACLEETPNYGAVGEVAAKYGVTPSPDEQSRLLAKVFRRGEANPAQCNFRIARILKCRALGQADKKTVLLSGSAEYIAAVAALPLNIGDFRETSVKVPELPFEREEEMRAVRIALSNCAISSSALYRPLCVCSDEHYVLSACMDVIRGAFASANVAEINASSFGASAFAARRDNVVLRSLRERERNVAVFVFEGETECGKSEGALGFIVPERRRAYKLEEGISLDLSDLFVVVLCDRHNLPAFAECCNVVIFGELTFGEKRNIVRAAIDRNAALFGLRSVQIDEDALSSCCGMDIDLAVGAIGRIFQTFERGTDETITAQRLSKALSANARSHAMLGFGG